MLRDTILYLSIALAFLSIIAGIPGVFGLEPSRLLILGLILYFAWGAYAVFRVCGQQSRHAIGQATFKDVVSNIWWTAWWPWFLWKKWLD